MPEALHSMSGWWDQRSLFTRLLVYAVTVILVFVMATSVGVVAALVVSANVSWPTGERARPDGPSPAGEQGKIPQHHQDKLTQYVDGVGEIQANSVEAFLDSHEKLRRYDTLTSSDIQEMQANQAALQGFTEQASDLNAPQKYREQKDAFVSAIDELHEAAQLAYALAADPISATQADFDDYDRLVDEAAADLRRSNQILGKDFEGIEGVREVSA
jgi:hypothetical protein